MNDEAAPPAAAVWREARIERIAQSTRRVKRFFVRAAMATPVAGQHVELRLTAEDGYTAQRGYSIASAPDAAEIELLIERFDDGEVSPFFHDIAQPGDTIELRGPLGGHFVWRPADGGPLLLVGGGSGIAPLLAMVRAWAQGVRDAPLLLVYSARVASELVAADELRALAATSEHFRFVAAITREAPSQPDDLAQRLDAVVLRDLLARWGHAPRHAFVCGANRFVEAVADGLLDAGVRAAVIRTERYGGA